MFWQWIDGNGGVAGLMFKQYHAKRHRHRYAVLNLVSPLARNLAHGAELLTARKLALRAKWIVRIHLNDLFGTANACIGV